ncbi:MAG TPA: hypothetical protein VJT31_11135 [Rugosimonospora sp.]|nr:hypothetical protein [Rugosimonospora sp.]
MPSNVGPAGVRAGVVIIAVLAGTALVAGACSPKNKTTAPPSAPASPAGSPSPTVDPAVAKAIDTYNGYLAAYAAASQTANPDDPNLTAYLGDPLLTSTKFSLEQLKSRGEVQVGAQKATVVSSKVDMAAKPPTVTLQTCLDYSAIKLVYAANQSPVPNSALKQTKVGATVTVAQYPDGRWLVNNSKQSGATC